MEILGSYGREELAVVHVARLRGDNRYLVEFVESLQPPIPRERKWVLIVSTLFGCPVRCRMCDAGTEYAGRLDAEEILAQIDSMIRSRFPGGSVPIPKLKIQFARMGEPSLNPEVLEVLRELPARYDAPGLLPSLSTVAPSSAGPFLEALRALKDDLYDEGRFQLQFSIHTTDPEKRDALIPVRKWPLSRIATYGERFVGGDDKKIALNFNVTEGYPVDPEIIGEHFDHARFVIKLTTLNPTAKVRTGRLVSGIDPADPVSGMALVDGFRARGFEVILSIGEVEENRIGSNCGMFVTCLRGADPAVRADYETGLYAMPLMAAGDVGRVEEVRRDC